VVFSVSARKRTPISLSRCPPKQSASTLDIPLRNIEEVGQYLRVNGPLFRAGYSRLDTATMLGH
jgi:hypothetical protein